MKKSYYTLLITLLILPLISCRPAISNKPIAYLNMMMPTYADNADILDSMRQECTLPTQLLSFIDKYARHQNLYIKAINNPVIEPAEQVLTVEITRIAVPIDGTWSTEKTVSVKGQLTENNQMIGDFVATRSSAGLLTGIVGRCFVIERCMKALAKDISLWLREPTMNARLGEI